MDEQVEEKQEHTAEEFAEAYTKLCKEFGFVIQPELGYKQQIDGTFTIGVQLKVAQIPKQ